MMLLMLDPWHPDFTEDELRKVNEVNQHMMQLIREKNIQDGLYTQEEADESDKIDKAP